MGWSEEEEEEEDEEEEDEDDDDDDDDDEEEEEEVVAESVRPGDEGDEESLMERRPCSCVRSGRPHSSSSPSPS